MVSLVLERSYMIHFLIALAGARFRRVANCTYTQRFSPSSILLLCFSSTKTEGHCFQSSTARDLCTHVSNPTERCVKAKYWLVSVLCLRRHLPPALLLFLLFACKSSICGLSMHIYVIIIFEFNHRADINPETLSVHERFWIHIDLYGPEIQSEGALMDMPP